MQHSDLIIKGVPHDLLTDAVRRVHAGGRYLPQVVKQTLANRTPSSDLTPREREIVVRIAQGKAGATAKRGMFGDQHESLPALHIPDSRVGISSH